MITIRECAEVLCDDCDDGCWVDGEGGIPHWASLAEAIAYLTDTGWTLPPAGRAGGPVVCPACTARRICADQGHTWLPPAACRCQGRLPAHRQHGCRAWRDCAMCGYFEEITNHENTEMTERMEG